MTYFLEPAVRTSPLEALAAGARADTEAAAAVAAVAPEGAAPADALADRAESKSRFSGVNSARKSPADWYRRLRSFSIALQRIGPKPAGNCGFSRRGEAGASSRIALKINAVLSPAKASFPVAISYSTIPNEKRSLLVSSSLPRSCSADM